MKGTGSIQARLKLTRHCCRSLNKMLRPYGTPTKLTPHVLHGSQSWEQLEYINTRTYTHEYLSNGNDDHEQSMAQIFSSFRSSTGQYSSAGASRHSCQESVRPLSFQIVRLILHSVSGVPASPTPKLTVRMVNKSHEAVSPVSGIALQY